MESSIPTAFPSRRKKKWSNVIEDVPAYEGAQSRLLSGYFKLSWLSPISFLGISMLLLPVLLAFSLVQGWYTPVLRQFRLAVSSSGECSNPPYDNCSFYADCLETRYNCGPSGYPIGYGRHFCQSFSNERSKLSTQGQTWMLNTMHCLQTALVPEATGVDNTTCSALEDKAFATHAGCYVKSGLCTLPPTDWLAVMEIVQLKTLFRSWDAFKATVEAEEGCLSLWTFAMQQDLF